MIAPDTERSFELLMFSDEERAALSRERAEAEAARWADFERRCAKAGFDIFGGPLDGEVAS